MKHIQKDEAINLACAVGYNFGFFDTDGLLQFVKEIQAHTLLNFSKWVCESGDPKERVTWESVAINAVFEADNFGAFTI